MSSSLEEVDGNCNLTTDLEEKDSDTTLYDEKVLVNGDACFHDDVEKLNRAVSYESEEVLIDNSKKLSSLVNGTNCIFTVYEIFVTGKIVVFYQYLYNKRFFSVVESHWL